MTNHFGIKQVMLPGIRTASLLLSQPQSNHFNASFCTQIPIGKLIFVTEYKIVLSSCE